MNYSEPDMYRHIKSGKLYQAKGMAIIESTLDPAVIYQCLETGMHWVRPAKEFFDGRFEPVLTGDRQVAQSKG